MKSWQKVRSIRRKRRLTSIFLLHFDDDEEDRDMRMRWDELLLLLSNCHIETLLFTDDIFAVFFSIPKDVTYHFITQNKTNQGEIVR